MTERRCRRLLARTDRGQLGHSLAERRTLEQGSGLRARSKTGARARPGQTLRSQGPDRRASEGACAAAPKRAGADPARQGPAERAAALGGGSVGPVPASPAHGPRSRWRGQAHGPSFELMMKFIHSGGLSWEPHQVSESRARAQRRRGDSGISGVPCVFDPSRPYEAASPVSQTSETAAAGDRGEPARKGVAPAMLWDRERSPRGGERAELCGPRRSAPRRRRGGGALAAAGSSPVPATRAHIARDWPLSSSPSMLLHWQSRVLS